MGCHDGSLAVDSMLNTPNNIPGGQPSDNGSKPGVNANKFLAGTAMLGTNLSNDHPVSFSYDTSYLGEGGTAGGLVLTSTVQAKTAVRLFSGVVECATCHDAHNPANAAFLRSTNQGSLLCLQCHIK
jgi:predicted CXXCH cytochrome family protein